MFVRTTRRKLADGSYTVYAQLARSFRDPTTKRPRTEIIVNLGRVDSLDKEQILRVVRGLLGLITPSGAGATDDVKVLSSRPIGARWAVKALWDDVGLDAVVAGRVGRPVERARETLWSLVEAQLIAPGVPADVPLDPAVSSHMIEQRRVLLEALGRSEESVAKAWWSRVEALPEVEEDLAFGIVSPTIRGEIRHALNPHLRVATSLHTELVVSASGLPLCLFPASSSLASVRPPGVPRPIVRLGTSDVPRATVGSIERLGEESEAVRAEFLSQPGRFRRLNDATSFRVSGSSGSEQRRFVLTRSSARADDDRNARRDVIDRIEGDLEGFCRTCDPRSKTTCCLEEDPTTSPYVRRTRGRDLRIDRSAIRDARRRDGVDLFAAHHTDLPARTLIELVQAADDLIARLFAVPTHSHKTYEDRGRLIIRGLAVLIAALAELRTGTTFPALLDELDAVCVVTLRNGAKEFDVRTEVTPGILHRFHQLGVPIPPSQ